MNITLKKERNIQLLSIVDDQELVAHKINHDAEDKIIVVVVG